MIAVIADDFTGAAELAGIALRYGLTTCITLDNSIPSSFDVVIVCTDSRSVNKEEALQRTTDAVEALQACQPQWWYKKIDSVLRGYVIDEALVQMKLCNKNNIFILPANPSLHRTIESGNYYIDGKKITETGFVNDPEFPVRSANINQMLNNDSVQVLEPGTVLPANGIVVGEAKSKEDVIAWANAINNDWVKIGAGDFFDALLQQHYSLQQAASFQMQSPHLYVCGTAYAERKAFIKNTSIITSYVSYLPEIITETWLASAATKLKRDQKMILAIDESAHAAATLRDKMAKVVQQLIVMAGVKELFIEGGSTAAAILQACNITQLEPVQEWQRGVVRMKAASLFITVKPGSYALPTALKQLYQ